MKDSLGAVGEGEDGLTWRLTLGAVGAEPTGGWWRAEKVARLFDCFPCFSAAGSRVMG